ncbi:hypothetical protein [Curvivirga sp.]|uniref:hypothetical protein n=1 Tax=Curvivirga sp. TaxID=2856848 RepID=UPI003B5987F1
MNAFVETLRNFGAIELLFFLGSLVFISLLLKGSGKWTKWHRRKVKQNEVSYKDPDNLPDWRTTIWRTRLQIIFSAIAIIGFTFIAIMHSI